jgi:thiamine pyrophosphokinase
MKGILLLNGQPYEGAIDTTDAIVYCCDGAYNWACGKVKIDKNIGDFDSISGTPYPPPEEVYPSEKDFTDGEIALFKLIDAGATDIEIYGGGGGREDHFLGNLHLLYAAHKRGVKAAMITKLSVMFVGVGRVELSCKAGTTVSVLPFGGNVHIMESAGLKYSYPQTISYGECRGISNIVEESGAFIKFADGCVALIIINRGNV